MADELLDVDFACTGDEQVHGDMSCGGDAAGELSSRVTLEYDRPAAGGCSTASGLTLDGRLTLAQSAETPTGLGSLAPGQTRCFRVGWLFVSDPGKGPEDQRAQSDRATWRFKWIAQV